MFLGHELRLPAGNDLPIILHERLGLLPIARYVQIAETHQLFG